MENSALLHLQKVTGMGGTEQMFLRLGKGLSERGWECHFGLIEETERPVDDYAVALAEAGWQVNRLRLRRHLSLPVLIRIRQWLRDLNPDLLHTHLIHGDLYGRIASAGLDLVRVTTKHNDDAFKLTPGYGLCARMLNRGFDAGVAISEHLRSFYRDELGVRTPSFQRIYYGLDPVEFLSSNPEQEQNDTNSRDQTDTIRFGMVARLVSQKGHRDLIRAFDRVVSSHPPARLILVGSGPLENTLRKLVGRLGLEDNVQFEGFRADIPNLLRRWDVFVHPSRWEGFGLVFLEAMAARLPVVATRVSAIPEIVHHGETGLLVPPRSPERLAEVMISMIDDPERARSMGEAGYQRLKEKFSIESMIDAHDRLYRSLLNGVRPD